MLVTFKGANNLLYKKWYRVKGYSRNLKDRRKIENEKNNITEDTNCTVNQLSNTKLDS